MNKNEIPNYLSASSPKGLRRLMIKNNTRLAMTVVYFDFQNINSKWYCWYNEPIHLSKEIEEANGIAQNDRGQRL